MTSFIVNEKEKEQLQIQKEKKKTSFINTNRRNREGVHL